MIVFDPNENVMIGMQIENQKIPAVFISNVRILKEESIDKETLIKMFMEA